MWLWGVVFNMKKFTDLNRMEQRKAIDLALNDVLSMVYNGEYEVEENTLLSEKEMKEILLPEAIKVAETAYYPEVSDVIIKLWE